MLLVRLPVDGARIQFSFVPSAPGTGHLVLSGSGPSPDEPSPQEFLEHGVHDLPRRIDTEGRFSVRDVGEERETAPESKPRSEETKRGSLVMLRLFTGFETGKYRFLDPAVHPEAHVPQPGFIQGKRILRRLVFRWFPDSDSRWKRLSHVFLQVVCCLFPYQIPFSKINLESAPDPSAPDPSAPDLTGNDTTIS